MKKRTVLIIGCGGTGSWFVRHLAKEPELFKGFTFYLFDHDTVEERNLERQDFQEEDIRAYKAVVLSERLLEVGISALPVIDWRNLNFDVRPDFVFLFVDNVAGRNFYYQKLFKDVRDEILLWLDSGNGKTDGQIFMLNSDSSEGDVKLYESFLRTALDEEFSNSCLADVQSVTINYLMSFAAFRFFKDVLNGKSVPRYFSVNRNGDNLGTEKTLRILKFIGNCFVPASFYESVKKLFANPPRDDSHVEQYVPFVEADSVFVFLSKRNTIQWRVPLNPEWNFDKEAEILMKGDKIIIVPRGGLGSRGVVPSLSAGPLFLSQIKEVRENFLSGPADIAKIASKTNDFLRIKALWDCEEYIKNIIFLRNLEE